MDEEIRRDRDRLEMEEYVRRKKPGLPGRYRELDEVVIELISRYAPTLTAIGVDFLRPDVEEAIYYCCIHWEQVPRVESAFQSLISYWHWAERTGEKLFSPNDFLLDAIGKNWRPHGWSDKFLNNPLLKSPGVRWEEEAKQQWGTDIYNKLVDGVTENPLCTGGAIHFRTGKSPIDLRRAKNMGFTEVLKYAQNVYGQI